MKMVFVVYSLLTLILIVGLVISLSGVETGIVRNQKGPGGCIYTIYEDDSDSHKNKSLFLCRGFKVNFKGKEKKQKDENLDEQTEDSLEEDDEANAYLYENAGWIIDLNESPSTEWNIFDLNENAGWKIIENGVRWRVSWSTLDLNENAIGMYGEIIH